MENIGTWGGEKAEQKETMEDFFKWILGRRGGKEEATAVTLTLVFTKGSFGEVDGKKRIPWMEEPGGLQSMGSLQLGHD